MLRIRIDNMNCGGCAKSVRAALLALVPDAAPHFDLDAKEVHIETAQAALILTALREGGWKARDAAG